MVLDQDKREHMESIYYDPGHVAGYASANDLYKFLKKEGLYVISRKEVDEFLQSSEVHTTHLEKKRAKHWYGVTTPGPGYMVDIDTGYFDLGKGPYKYVIIGIDTFNRKAVARPVKDLKAGTVKTALMEMLDEYGYDVAKVRGDAGSEFKNKTVQSALQKRGIQYIRSFPPHKSNYAERILRFLKRKLYMAAQHSGDSRWDRNLQAVISSYNSRFHTALGMSPDQVTADNIAEVRLKLKNKRLRNMPPPKPYAYDIHDRVRVNYDRVPFRKNFLEQNSTIVYFVTSRYKKANIARYTLKDQLGRAVPGSFVEQQLVRVIVNDDTVYRVEKILKYKNINGVRHALVKWYNYSSRYNSYLPASQVKGIRKLRKKKRN